MFGKFGLVKNEKNSCMIDYAIWILALRIFSIN